MTSFFKVLYGLHIIINNSVQMYWWGVPIQLSLSVYDYGLMFVCLGYIHTYRLLVNVILNLKPKYWDGLKPFLVNDYHRAHSKKFFVMELFYAGRFLFRYISDRYD